MKKIFFTLSIIVFLFRINGQTPNFIWAKSMGGVHNDKGNSIAVDASGNVYSTGTFSAIADFDPGPGTYTLNPGTVGDIFISKLDASGNFVWAKQIGGTNAGGEGNGIVTDASGNVYVTGFVLGNTDLDPGPGTYTVNPGGIDVFVLKLDIAGNTSWARIMGGLTYDDYGMGIVVGTSGNVYTTGYFRGSADFDPGTATFNLTAGTGDDDVFISKLNSSGNFVWAKQFDGSANDVGHSIDLDASENVFTTGEFRGTVDFNPATAINNLSASAGADIFISKLDLNGNYVWARRIGAGFDDIGYSIKIDNASNVCVSGLFRGAADFDPGPATYTINTLGSFEGFIAKYNTSGNFIWAKEIGDIQYNYYSIAIDASNNVYSTGRFSSTNDFDPGPGVYNMSPLAGSSYAIYVLKLDVSGNFVWAQSGIGVGGPTNDRSGRGIVVDPSNNIYITGIYAATIDFDFGPGTYTLTSTTGSNPNDIYVLKMGQFTCVAPAAPTNTTPIANLSVCSGNSTTLIATTSGTVNWYATATSTTILSSGNSFTTPVLSAGTYTYYAEDSTCTVSATRTPIVFTVNPLPVISVNNGTICAGQNFTITPSGASTYSINGGNFIVSPTVTANYTVNGTDANGCMNNTIQTLVVNALPVVSINSVSPICAGQSATLNVSGALSNTYVWSTSAITNSIAVTPTTTTLYSVTATDINGCSGIAAQQVTVNPLPVINIITSSSVICVGQTTTLTASGANTYIWNTTATTTSITDSPTITTTYSVNGTDANGCSNSATITQTVSLCTGLEEQLAESGFSIYPNPAHKFVNIKLVTDQGSIMEIIDLTGKTVMKEGILNRDVRIDISSLNSGFYFIRILDDHKIYQSKFIIN